MQQVGRADLFSVLEVVCKEFKNINLKIVPLSLLSMITPIAIVVSIFDQEKRKQEQQ